MSYSINIYFEDWNGGRNFGVSKNDEDNILLSEFRDFCRDAGIAYGFTENQMDRMFNWNLNDDTD